MNTTFRAKEVESYGFTIKITSGYKSVTRWCINKELRAFLIQNKFKIPKEYLIDFMVSDRCITIAKKSDKHIEMMTEALQYINMMCAPKKDA